MSTARRPQREEPGYLRKPVSYGGDGHKAAGPNGLLAFPAVYPAMPK